MEEITPSSPTLIKLLERIDSGELKLPDFQRDYNWTPSRVKKLIASIHKNHPSGSLLFLAVDRDKQVLNERSFESADNCEKATEFLVLDGQQRLTSCYYVFYNKGSRSYYIDLDKVYCLYKEGQLYDADLYEDKIIVDRKHIGVPDGKLNNKLFPMGCFYNREAFKNMISKYKRSLPDKEDDYYIFIDEKFELYCNNFLEYQFPVIQLPKELTLDAICKIFQNINTTGLKLSAFDICVAKFTRFGIQLKTKTDDAIEKYPNIKIIADKDKTIILQTMALLNGYSPKMSKLADNLDEKSFSKWKKTIKGLDESIEILNKMGVGCDKSLTILPYQPFIALFSAVLAEVDYFDENIAGKSAIYDKLKKFFYYASLSGRYQEGTDNKMKDDFYLLCNWISNGKTPEDINNIIYWNNEKIKKVKKGSAIGKAVLCLINSKIPKDFYNDEKCGIGNDRKTSDIHHIFPKSTYKQIDKDYLESVFNLTFITSDTNKNIKDKTTQNYIQDIIETMGISESALKSRLETHFINDKSYTAMINENYESFINNRKEIIRKYFEESTGLAIRLTDDDGNSEDYNDEAFIEVEE